VIAFVVLMLGGVVALAFGLGRAMAWAEGSASFTEDVRALRRGLSRVTRLLVRPKSQGWPTRLR
jgi:hypothetical protein